MPIGIRALSVTVAGLAMSAVAATAVTAADYSDIDVTLIIYTDATVEFWVPAIQGANDAAEQLGLNLDIQYGDSDPLKQNDIVQTAIANEVDGIALSLYNDDAFDATVCQAVEAGIPVIAFNVDDSQQGANNCRYAYIGQFMEDAGELIARRMIAEHGIGEGDLVFTPVEFPEAVYAVQRHAGVSRVLAEVGATTEVIRTGTNPAEALDLMTQYLLSRPETAAIIGLGLTPTTSAPQAIQTLGIDIPIGGFDLSTDIAQGIKDGVITATVDQQPYFQGYFSVVQLALNARYGLAPSNMNTGGTGLVDASNVDVVLEYIGTTR